MSGYNTTQGVLTFGFVASALVHMAIILPRLGDLPTLKDSFVPSIAALDPVTTTLERGVQDLIQWDGVICTMSTAVATLWFARNVKELFGILAWYIVATLGFGPGAAIYGVFMWREMLLNGLRSRGVALSDSKK
jgi:hypothetical protein